MARRITKRPPAPPLKWNPAKWGKIVHPLPPPKRIKYETKVLEAEFEDLGLLGQFWTSETVPRQKVQKVAPGDEHFELLCHPFLEERLLCLERTGNTANNNTILDTIEKGLAKPDNPFGETFDPPNEYIPFGEPIGRIRKPQAP